MAKIYCNVAENGIEYRYEETDCPIFVKKIQWRSHQNPKVIEYLGVLNDDKVRQSLKAGIYQKESDHFFHRALVKHGHGVRCGFYPLPLIFATKELRELVAKERGIEPPNENWVTAKQKEIIQYYELEKKTFGAKLAEFLGISFLVTFDPVK